MEKASTSRRSAVIQRATSAGTPTDDIALEDIKHPDAAGFAAEAQEDPRASVSREAGERDPLALREKILDDGQLNELRQYVCLAMSQYEGAIDSWRDCLFSGGKSRERLPSFTKNRMMYILD